MIMKKFLVFYLFKYAETKLEQITLTMITLIYFTFFSPFLLCAKYNLLETKTTHIMTTRNYHFKSQVIGICPLERKENEVLETVPDWSRQGGRSSVCAPSPSLPG